MLARLAFSECFVAADSGDSGSWHTARIAWGNIPEDSTHHLVLQDDLVLCQDFVLGVIRALRHKPAAVVSFFAGQFSAIDKSKEQKRAWTTIPGYLSGQAIAMPSLWARSLVGWCDANIPGPEDSDFWVRRYKRDTPEKLAHAQKFWSDRRVKWFAQQNRLPILFTSPSLVDHAGWEFSTYRTARKNERARWFVGEDNSALSVDWRC